MALRIKNDLVDDGFMSFTPGETFNDNLWHTVFLKCEVGFNCTIEVDGVKKDYNSDINGHTSSYLVTAINFGWAS